MARPRSPNRDKAFQLWLESGKKRQLKDIAAELQVSEEQVRKWKNQDKWDKVTLPNAKGNVTNRKGGQPGNRNAVGNKGGAAPAKNKNAVTTGEFEALLFDCLDDDEKSLVANIPDNKQRLLMQEIGLLSVRERRMMKRIEALKQSSGYKEKDGTEQGVTLVSIETGEEGTKKKYEGKLGQIQAIEEALTRVQARKQRSIESLHKFGFDDAQIKLETKRVEMAARAAGEVEEEERQDDGFLDALKGSVNADWEEWEGGTENQETSDI